MRLLTAVIVFLFVSSCGPRSGGPDDGEHRYVIRTPDSLRTVKDHLMRLYHRWGAGAYVHFILSDSAVTPLFLNDSLAYHNDLFDVTADSVMVDGHAMNRHHTVLAFRGDGFARLVVPPGGRPWLLFQALDELCNEMGSAENALIVLERNQPVIKRVLKGGRWQDGVNVFDERRRFDELPPLADSFFDIKGESLSFDRALISGTARKYPPDRIRFVRPTLFVYPDFETKARLNQGVAEYSFDLEKKIIHVVKCRLVEERLHEILSEYWATQIYGNRYPWLTLGLSIRSAGTWYGKPLAWWRKKSALLRLCDIPQLLAAKSRDQNSFLMGYLAAHFWDEQASEPEEVLRTARTRISRFRPVLNDPPSDSGRQTVVPYFKGVCYAHTNGVGSGYMSRTSAASLEYLRALGVDAISLTPFGYSGSDTSSQISFVLDEMWDETLSSLFKAADDAHQKGMTVMMKPHLWLGSGQWCGDINVPKDELAAWESAYARFITYHALIAELAGMESVCVGVELPHMTVHTDLWRRIIGQVRVAFGGQLTFGGNWNEEYEKIQFWDDLDFIGVQQYFPLMDREGMREEDVRVRARALRTHFSDLANHWQRPVVFTEVGFPSTVGALMNPHLENFSMQASEEEQALGYRILVEAFADQPFFKGFFWWKFESDEASRRRSTKSFSFRAKQAEVIVKNTYSN